MTTFPSQQTQMDPLAAWRANLLLKIEVEFNSIDVEQDFVDRAALGGPMSLHGIGLHQRQEGGGSVPGKRPNKESGDMKLSGRIILPLIVPMTTGISDGDFG